jgi:hypothetical protein
MFGQPNMTSLLNELYESSSKDNSIGWGSCLMKRRSLARIPLFLPLYGHVKTKKEQKIEIEKKMEKKSQLTKKIKIEKRPSFQLN